MAGNTWKGHFSMRSKVRVGRIAEIGRGAVCWFVLVTCMVLSPTSPRLWASGTPPPVLTAVTPNPLTVGTIKVTIQGTGLISGALVYLDHDLP
ncbi:MAG TPA: hypothetical protein VKB38_23260 [Terracidiphilus sp.]|nr:hypothetical protein [Terracidiphilus sp.]